MYLAIYFVHISSAKKTRTTKTSNGLNIVIFYFDDFNSALMKHFHQNQFQTSV